MKNWINSGAPWIWLTGGAVTISMIMVVGLLALIAVRGFGHFWPAAVIETTITQTNGTQGRILGELADAETTTAAAMRDAGYIIPEDQLLVERYLFKVGNRDITGRDFAWHLGNELGEWRYPDEAMVLERREWGNFYGYPLSIQENGETVVTGEAVWPELLARLERSNRLFAEIRQIERYDIGNINLRLERIRLDGRRLQMDGSLSPSEREERQAELAEQRQALNEEYRQLQARLAELNRVARRDTLTAEIADGREVQIPLALIVRALQPNTMSVWEKLGFYADKFQEFVSDYPREANTEGGIFPAIFGTVMMVILMSIIVTPFGILAAIYLREYAKQGTLVRLIRISVNNLAGVPSIVFGVFGLGFFVYFLGGNLDQLFYPEKLPAPTFGTPGILWASLTLALLTLPVVIVSTEEGLSRIPRSIREGSLAVGATKAETLWRVVIPLASPAMMTGLILAVARAAGEVAPLMLVGVVKLAPNLPVDSNFPFLHLERKFMHLGFHIYDVGFQSPNVEAARPLVYATALTLVIIILVLNFTAIVIRNHLREKYRSEGD